jgi:hypothetical protein
MRRAARLLGARGALGARQLEAVCIAALPLHAPSSPDGLTQHSRGYSAAGVRHSGCRGTQLPHGRLLPPACAALLVHARWDSTRAAPLAAALPDVAPEVVQATAADASALASEVASIAADSNAGVATLQYMVEWFHLSLDLPWCACCVGKRAAASRAVQHWRQCLRQATLNVASRSAGGSPSWRPRARCAAPSCP